MSLNKLPAFELLFHENFCPDLCDHFVPASEHCLREEILAKFLYWLMGTYVVELLRSFFYITETMSQKTKLHYYRKLVWGKLQNIAIRSHIAEAHLRALTSEEIEALRHKKCLPVVSKLRFIPKTQGLRPIVKVSSVLEAPALSKESREKKMHHYNTQLKNLFSVLNYERTINTSIIGSSAFGKDDIYRTWKKFVTKVHESGGEMPHFYFVKVLPAVLWNSTGIHFVNLALQPMLWIHGKQIAPWNTAGWVGVLCPVI